MLGTMGRLAPMSGGQRLTPLDRPSLELERMLHALRLHEIRWIMTGSTVLAAYSTELRPNDLDVTPALDAQNLRRVAALLTELEALPIHNPDWEKNLTIEECYAWKPEPASEEQLDHLFVTRLGLLDIVPRLCGTYEELLPKATPVDAFGEELLLCDPDEVLNRMPPRRKKDQRRAAQLREVRERIATGLGPISLSRLGRPSGDSS